ncbi:MAG: hypothetical protein A2469_01390 [Candidatus Magasanikbacteria bacterium RIFOXYC2_FULL_40_16]|uniref:3D domain-containing protein n=3 Tax=Candidatus Magasanikiibacteriota TaxID=1752731 RepID=A0A1F6NDG2_9BACT|nr:MAG: hypothetical protein A2373_04460 [Candidatus Magasanikbacteria bacterium RIFOXYB1_FULL_40_15]OGH86840.1 MAG: hypothetical protein A2301_02205 [Candidatus Magasanikbacteria bacterium RIFOXYB2_FULL_40_13]OGH87698.1 MAG: hypothetical protein A2206_00510 [Candidatus Magasanikbacteria bacterium RIFOXYA1_FULL_40_8]OGH90412.1 MAG: hypothetical protein A2469_01390 [Candidatus Magasanikbacteria bacterium RIFOXYC2_FULL_40_16]
MKIENIIKGKAKGMIKKVAKISKKFNKKAFIHCLKGRLVMSSIALLVFPFWTNMAEIEKASFPVAQDRAPLQTIWVVATAYSSDPAQTDSTPCIPADGYDLCAHYERFGEGNTIAANFLPLGAQIKIPELYGEKIFVVHDRMNRRYGYGRIDIWMPTKEEAKIFGVKYLKLEYYGGSKWKIASN